MDRRAHADRCHTLPEEMGMEGVSRDVDLMIEAKDKEQAVFELMRRFKLPGHERIADMVAYEREDQDRPPAKKKKKDKEAKREEAQVLALG